MQLEVALYNYLSTYAGLIALTSTRIYPNVLPQSPTYPAVTFEMISGPRVHAMGSDPGLTFPRYEFTCWGSTKASARAVALQIIDALQDKTGTIGGTGGVTIQRIFLEDESDGESDPILSRYARIVEFIIWAEE